MLILNLIVSNNSSMAPREVSASMELDSTTSVCSTCQIAFTGNNAAADLKRHEEIKHMDELDEEEDAAGSDDDDFDFSTSSAIPVNGNGSIIATTVPVSIEVNSSLGVKREASNTGEFSLSFAPNLLTL